MIKKYLMPLLVLAAMAYGALFAISVVRAPFPARIWLRMTAADEYGKTSWDVTDVRYEVRGDSVFDSYTCGVVDDGIVLTTKPNFGDKWLKKLGHRYKPETKAYRQAGRRKDNEQGTWWLWQKQQD